MPPGHLLHHDFAVLRCHCHLQLRTPSVWSARPGRCTASALAAQVSARSAVITPAGLESWGLYVAMTPFHTTGLQAHTTLAERTKAADTLPEGFRCPVCFDVNFPSRAKLIQHMVSVATGFLLSFWSSALPNMAHHTLLARDFLVFGLRSSIGSTSAVQLLSAVHSVEQCAITAQTSFNICTSVQQQGLSLCLLAGGTC